MGVQKTDQRAAAQPQSPIAGRRGPTIRFSGHLDVESARNPDCFVRRAIVDDVNMQTICWIILTLERSKALANVRGFVFCRDDDIDLR
jgi:hypothetical protein